MTSMSLFLESSTTNASAAANLDQIRDGLTASAAMADPELDADELRWQLEWSRRNIED